MALMVNEYFLSSTNLPSSPLSKMAVLAALLTGEGSSSVKLISMASPDELI